MVQLRVGEKNFILKGIIHYDGDNFSFRDISVRGENFKLVFLDDLASEFQTR